MSADSFGSCFSDFVRYFNAMVPLCAGTGILDARVCFVSDDSGKLLIWTEDNLVHPCNDDMVRYLAFCDHLFRMLIDLNRYRMFSDLKIERMFDVFDQEGCTRFEEVTHG